MDLQTQLVREVENLLSGQVLNGDPEFMGVRAAGDAFLIAKHISERLDDRLKALKAYLLTKIAENGEQLEKGHQQLEIDGSQFLRERRQAKSPDATGIEKLLLDRSQARGEAFNKEDAFDKKIVYELSDSKVEHLIRLGKLSEPEVNALKPVTFALKAKPAPLFEQKLVEAGQLQPGEVPTKTKLLPDMPKQPRGKAKAKTGKQSHASK
jgi:hypothetical protein